MKAAIKELRSSFQTLLRSKRGGVVAAVLAAAGRTSTGQVDLGKALAAALRELPGNQQVLPLGLHSPGPYFRQCITGVPSGAGRRNWQDMSIFLRIAKPKSGIVTEPCSFPSTGFPDAHPILLASKLSTSGI